MSIELKAVTIDLPIYSTSAKSLRKSLTAATVGGKLFSRRDDTLVVRALDRLSLKISDGQRVGLVGRNGSGKTTLLKVMAGVYTPTSGAINVQGQVSAALDASLGLDHELSGRENIYYLGYYRGRGRQEIESQVEDILSAAGLGNFSDLPVRSYSAGMLSRLIFAIATAFQPDVLLLDEWLLAGDAQFMAKAARRAEKFVSEARIVVIASHSTAIIRQMCSHVAFLRAGQLVAFGPTDDVLAAYETDAAEALLT